MEKQELRKMAWRAFFWEALLFSLTMVLGIFTGLRLGSFLSIGGTALNYPPPPFLETSLSREEFYFSAAQFLIHAFFALLFVLFIIFVIKSRKAKNLFFNALFVLITGLGGLLVLIIWLQAFLALVLIFFLILIWLKTKSILAHNLLLILGIIGLGSATGLRIEPWTGVIFLVVFSIYDYIAVYKTKHMIRMAKEMAEQKAILALIIPQKAAHFKATLKDIEPGNGFLVLGGGDILFPLLFCVSLLFAGTINAFVVAVFSLFGLFAGFLFFMRQPIIGPKQARAPIPALPPIALFSIIGFLLTLIAL